MTSSIEQASGKNKSHENFPVGSFLIRADLRHHVHCYYDFARNADDIADSKTLSEDEKVYRLQRMAAIIKGERSDESPSSSRMHESLKETGLDPCHCLELLEAFLMDSHKKRYQTWSELIDYCRLSAIPVGRYLLDLHKESKESWPASDALCAALQILNHFQDCQKDYLDLNRVYIPLDLMNDYLCQPENLLLSHLSTGMREVLNKGLAKVDDLLKVADPLPNHIHHRGLKSESAVIVALAKRLSTLLKKYDPLARRVELNKVTLILCTLQGLWRSIRGNHDISISR
jgi:farnesyl-diphosphate farnesyltransferase